MIDSRNFMRLLQGRWNTTKSLVCVGLDTDYERIPESVRVSSGSISESIAASLLRFNKEIVDATSDLVSCYKLQIAFYAAEGEKGLIALTRTIEYIHNTYPDIPVMLDAKRSDIGSVAEKYASELFGVFQADAATLLPYFGKEACEPFINRKEKGLFFLCHTSNPGAVEFQDVLVTASTDSLAGNEPMSNPVPLYQLIASKIAREWNENGNCGLVVGATFPQQLSEVREIVGDIPLLIPGIGAQEGDIKSTVKAGKDSRGQGMIISSSRAIIFASGDIGFTKAARNATEQLRDTINSYI
jgi:orotidine-5'-phosphate decarboxylase